MTTTRRLSPEEAAEVCHPRCRSSENIGPFAPCRCRCGGAAHASETLRQMNPHARKRAEAQMKADVLRGQTLMQIRIYLAGLKRDWKARGKSAA